MKLDVFLRTCSRQGVISGQQRCIPDSRETMILKCVSSLVDSIRCSRHQVKLWIVDDHSDDGFVIKLQEKISKIDSHIETLGGTGAQDSAVAQFNMAKNNGTDLVYLVEDDYFHANDAIDCMIDAWSTFNQIDEFHNTAIFPYDSIDRYERDFPEPCRLFYLDGLYWRTTTKTTFTVMLHHSNFCNSFGIFEYLGRNYTPTGITEDQTINKLWNNMVTFGGPIVLFNPVPSLAIHLEYQSPTNLTNGLLNWREKWNNYAI